MSEEQPPFINKRVRASYDFRASTRRLPRTHRPARVSRASDLPPGKESLELSPESRYIRSRYNPGGRFLDLALQRLRC